MIEVKSDKATGVQIEGSGDPLEQANDVLNIIGAAHKGFLMAQDTFGAMLFKLAICATLSDPNNAIWSNREAEGYAMRIPKRQTPPRPVRVPA